MGYPTSPLITDLLDEVEEVGALTRDLARASRLSGTPHATFTALHLASELRTSLERALDELKPFDLDKMLDEITISPSDEADFARYERKKASRS
jgi:hypothetical protein